MIASIEDDAMIERILEHLGHAGEFPDPPHPSRVASVSTFGPSVGLVAMQ